MIIDVGRGAGSADFGTLERSRSVTRAGRAGSAAHRRFSIYRSSIHRVFASVSAPFAVIYACVLRAIGTIAPMFDAQPTIRNQDESS